MEHAEQSEHNPAPTYKPGVVGSGLLGQPQGGGLVGGWGGSVGQGIVGQNSNPKMTQNPP